MPTVLLVRHGRTRANDEGVLAGRTPGVHLDEGGQQQATRAGERLGVLTLARVVSSPLERTVETARAIVRAQVGGPRLRRDRGLIECGYGAWTGRRLKELAKDPLWRTVQAHPSAVVFPEGEALADVQHRAVAAVRRHDAAVQAEQGPHAVWAAVSHGDVIKAVVADALGLHLDQFQRIMADPCSVTVIRYTPQRPFVLHLNDHGSDLSSLRHRPKGRRTRTVSSDAAVGGGAGTGGHGSA
ncbi:MAG: MSMEG_4193 family putative phosphomutase [Nocardioidaceae bacterium]|nr:MSMEG_4193 family putative phosphomutase [Nocardioidaceae bacterium]